MFVCVCAPPAVQEERQRAKEKSEAELELAGCASDDMPVEKILEAELAVEPKTETYVEGSIGAAANSVRHLSLSLSLSNTHSPNRSDTSTLLHATLRLTGTGEIFSHMSNIPVCRFTILEMMEVCLVDSDRKGLPLDRMSTCTE